MNIPYGVSDFPGLRRAGQVYLDRTDRIPLLEGMGKALVFLRPRRFGKSLFLSTLEAYYDRRTRDDHDLLFDGLAMGERPTAEAHRYFVMRWDFSNIDPNPPPRGVNAGVNSRVDRIGNEIHGYLNRRCASFLSDYREALGEKVRLFEDGFRSLDSVVDAVRRSGSELYLLIDEYDNFANEVLPSDRASYEELVRADGPFKFLFKWIKTALAGNGLARLFMAGVSPLVIADVTSGMNVARNVYLKPSLADLCGFTEGEVETLLRRVSAKKPDQPLDLDETLSMMRDWYDGYRFALGEPERVYNPTLVFYFLLELIEEGRPPRQMLDANLAADGEKLHWIADLIDGTGSRRPLMNLVGRDEPLEITELQDRFSLRELLDPSSQDLRFWASYLYYLGMLTLKRDETPARTLELVVPNEVARDVYVQSLRKMLVPSSSIRSEGDPILAAFFQSGALTPVLDYIEKSLFPVFSNRDALWANELTIKTLFLSLLWNPVSHISYSEPELGRRYADLCLLRRPDSRSEVLSDLLFEFKRLPLSAVGLSGEEVRRTSREELSTLAPVAAAIRQAESQLAAYGSVLEKNLGRSLELRSYAVVAIGFDRLLCRSLSQTPGIDNM